MASTEESMTRTPFGLAERVAIRAINFPESLQPTLQVHPLASKMQLRMRWMIAVGSEALMKTKASSQETASTDDVMPSSTLDTVRMRKIQWKS
jgi:hypothetical protein